MCPRFLPWTQQQMLLAAKPVSSPCRNGQFQVWKTPPTWHLQVGGGCRGACAQAEPGAL